VAADVNMMHIICPELKKTHWKEQYEGTEFPLPSEAQIERHVNLIKSSICLPPGLKRPNGRPKSTKRKQGFVDKQGFESGTFPRSSAVLVGIFRYGNGRIIFFEFRTTGSNIFNFGTTGSDLISIWERQNQLFWIWNDRINFFEFGNDRIRFNFNLGTTGSTFLNLERQDQIWSIW